MPDDFGVDYGYGSDYSFKSPPITVDDMDLTIRSFNCLKREGVTTVAELIKRSEEDLLDMRNFGQRGVEEVKAKLAEHGLHLANATSTPYTEDVVHEQVNIFRCRGVQATVSPHGDVDLNAAHFAAHEWEALCRIVDDMRRQPQEEGDIEEP